MPLLDSVLSMTNLCYERGEWRTQDDIVSAADWRGRAWPQVLREDFGYELKTGIGSYHGEAGKTVGGLRSCVALPRFFPLS